MVFIRNRFKGFDKKEKIPKFKTEELRNEYLEDLKAKKAKTRQQYLKIENYDSPALEKWKKSNK